VRSVTGSWSNRRPEESDHFFSYRSYARTIRATSSWRTTSRSLKSTNAIAFDILKDLARHDQSGALVLVEVDLGDVTVDHACAPYPRTREEHLHLRRRGVLRLVEMMNASLSERPA
jgi:hypothetical protein